MNGDKPIVLYGTGGNGKTFLLTLLYEIMGCYVAQCDSKVIEEDFDKHHKFFPLFGQNRIVYFNEIKKKKKI